MSEFEELQDLGGHIEKCSDCQEPLDAGSWFWYADPGGVHLTFCPDCKPDPDGYDVLRRATGIEFVSDRSGVEFTRVVGLPDRWFDGDD